MVLLCAVSNIFKVAKCFSGYGDGSSHEKKTDVFFTPLPVRPTAVCAESECVAFFISLYWRARGHFPQIS
jgi:hypothetical protein